MAQNLRPGPEWIAGVIVERLGPLSYLVETEAHQFWKRHVDQLKEVGDSPLRSTEFEVIPEWDSASPGSGEPSLPASGEPPQPSSTEPDPSVPESSTETASPEPAVETPGPEPEASVLPASSSPVMVPPSPGGTTGHRYPCRKRKPREWYQ